MRACLVAAAVAASLLASGAFAAGYVAPDGRTEAQLVAAHVLPDPAHPGVVNPAVTPATQARTICTQTPAGHKPIEGELDHRLSIEDGGAPADPANLWWMIYADRYGARVKDVLETKLSRRVCAGTLGLGEARQALLGNWLVAYQKYVGPLPK
ncbi:MAG: hypothetical protein V4466_12040 [Pseudomonadota bacterium]